MNISIENKELSINNAEDLMAAQRNLLEAFTESLLRSSEKEKERDEMEERLLKASGVETLDDLVEWLEDMSRAGYAGLSAEEIRNEVVAEALSNTDFDSVGELIDRMDDYSRAIENIYSEVSEFM